MFYMQIYVKVDSHAYECWRWKENLPYSNGAINKIALEKAKKKKYSKICTFLINRKIIDTG